MPANFWDGTQLPRLPLDLFPEFVERLESGFLHDDSTPRRDLLEIPNWPYAEMANGWGGVGFVAGTAGELRDALRAAHELKGFAVVECRVGSTDLSPLGKRYIQGSARKARARR